MSRPTNRDAARVFFAGLGQMGFHLSRHVAAKALDRDIPVIGFDTYPEARKRMSTVSGITTISELPADLSAGDVLCLSVPDGTAVRAVVSALGTLDHARGLTILDFSSVSPAEARAIADELSIFGIRYVDSPVTGGVVGANLGTLTTIVGASEESLGSLRWIADAFSTRVVFTNNVGAGALLKSLNNMIGNIAAIAAMEGIIVARCAGIPDEILLEVLNNGTAITYFSQVRYPKYVATQKFNAGMRIGLVNKDLQIALDAAKELGCNIRLCLAGRGMWADALKDLGPEADTTMMMDVVSRATVDIGVIELLDKK